MKKTRLVRKPKLKQRILAGLANIGAGILFGTGCLIAEYADSAWIHPETETSQSPKIATNQKKIAKDTAAVKLKAPDDSEETDCQASNN